MDKILSYTIEFNSYLWELALFAQQEGEEIIEFANGIEELPEDFDNEKGYLTRVQIHKDNDKEKPIIKVLFIPSVETVFMPKEYLEILQREEVELPNVFRHQYKCIQHFPFAVYERTEDPKEVPHNKVLHGPR